MKRICESFLEARTNPRAEKKKKENTKLTTDSKKEHLIRCLKCQQIKIQNFEPKISQTEQEFLLSSLPNKNDSFTSIADEVKTSDLKYNDLKPYKTIYSKEEISLKYNYIFDKFI